MEQKFINQKVYYSILRLLWGTMRQEYFRRKGCYQPCFYLDLI